jgi:hypothetical protein
LAPADFGDDVTAPQAAARFLSSLIKRDAELITAQTQLFTGGFRAVCFH